MIIFYNDILILIYNYIHSSIKGVIINKDFYNLHSDICKTFSNPCRLEIIAELKNIDMTVTELTKKIGIPQANISQHLAILRSKGLVSTKRQGNNIYYSISNIKLFTVFDLISEVLKESFQKNSQTVRNAIKKTNRNYRNC
jgi:ArsR family transcriptional regulator, virulence genes transcriptional regulator